MSDKIRDALLALADRIEEADEQQIQIARCAAGYIRSYIARQPAPVAVPEAMATFADDDVGRHAFSIGWNACRSAMLAAPSAPVAVGRGPVDRHYPNEEMDAIAVSRYRVGSSGAGTLHRHAVRAGDGEQELWRGSESDCKLVARKLAGAFLDGGLCLHALLNVAPPAAEQPGHSGDAADMVHCACGDAYQASSYGAGFIDGSGMCPNCDAAIPARDISAPPAAEQPDTVKVSRELLDELAGDLAAEVEARYPDKDHPALKHKYERDMRPVLEARALLAGGGA